MDYLKKLKFHFKPKKGWINDPNGLVYYNGWYHIFYQHCPDFEIPWKQPMVLGHARTKNFIDWEELPVALEPSQKDDADGCWSGTAAVKDNTLYLIYTSVIDRGDCTPKWKQTVSVAYSNDGIHFTKYENNPVISLVPPDGDEENFRDPACACIDGVYYCVMATGNKKANEARLLLYRSDDLFHWEYSGIMAQWADGLCAECPSFARFGHQFLLTSSVIPQNRKHYFSLMCGDFTNGKFELKRSTQPYKGPDQYAGQMFRDHLGRNLFISWISGWNYAGFAEKSIGCMSVPCEIKDTGETITVYPVEEVQHLLTSEDPAVTVTENGFLIKRNGRSPVHFEGTVRDLKILRDEYFVEVFVNGGETVYTAIL